MRVGVADALCELDGATRPGRRRLSVLAVHADRGEVRVRERERVPRRELFEDLDRLHTGGHRLAHAARAHLQTREERERLAFLVAVADGAVHVEHARDRLDRIAAAVGHVARVGVALEQVGADVGRERVGEAQRPCELRGRFAMRARRGGEARRGGRVAEDRVGVADGFGVVREPGDIGGAEGRCGEGVERASMQRARGGAARASLRSRSARARGGTRPRRCA